MSSFKELDWFSVAIGNLGGPAPAVRALKVSRQYIQHTWLNEGLYLAPPAHVAPSMDKGRVQSDEELIIYDLKDEIEVILNPQ